MALRVVGLHGGAAHITMVFEGKAMHLGSEKTLGKKGKRPGDMREMEMEMAGLTDQLMIGKNRAGPPKNRECNMLFHGNS